MPQNDEDIDGAELDEENETREVVLEKSEDILQSTTGMMKSVNISL